MDEPSPMTAAVRGNCPRCGGPGLFSGWVRFAPSCPACGLNYSDFNVGDGPAAFLILIVGAVTCGGAIALELAASPPLWVHLIWIPVAAVFTVAGLRLGKAWLLAQEYKHRAREGRLQK
jgi:uncharacterized protein (DUF983 family)